MANSNAAIAYHSSNMRNLSAVAHGRFYRSRAARDLTLDEEEEQHAEREVEAAEPHKREEHRAGVDAGARPLCGSEEAIDEPGLAAQLRGHPSRGVPDVREREREQQNPQHGPIALQS